MKKLITIITLTATMAASALPAMAAVNITDYSSTSIKNSYVDTAVIDKTSKINAKGGKVTVTAMDEMEVIDSIVDTIVDSGAKVITVEGHDIDITTADRTKIVDSIVGTYLGDKTKVINAKEIMSKIKIKR